MPALWLLILTVGGVGVLHTMVPDHWAPIAVVARQRGWSPRTTAAAAARAGLGHALSTVAIGLVAWIAGAVAAARAGHLVTLIGGFGLIGLGLWTIADGVRSLRTLPDDPERPAAETSRRTALLLAVGASPSLEVTPAFLASAPYGWIGFVAVAATFSVASVATYVVTCVVSHAGLQQIAAPAVERYGEIASGAFVAIVGILLLIWFR